MRDLSRFENKKRVGTIFYSTLNRSTFLLHHCSTRMQQATWLHHCYTVTYGANCHKIHLLHLTGLHVRGENVPVNLYTTTYKSWIQIILLRPDRVKFEIEKPVILILTQIILSIRVHVQCTYMYRFSFSTNGPTVLGQSNSRSIYIYINTWSRPTTSESVRWLNSDMTKTELYILQLNCRVNLKLIKWNQFNAPKSESSSNLPKSY